MRCHGYEGDHRVRTTVPLIATLKSRPAVQAQMSVKASLSYFLYREFDTAAIIPALVVPSLTQVFGLTAFAKVKRLSRVT